MPVRSSSRLALVGVAATALLAVACGDDSSGSPTTAAPTTAAVTAAPTTAASTTTAAAGQLAPMSAADQAAVDQAIADGVARVTKASPILAPPGLWVGVWDPAKGSYLTVRGNADEGQPATLDDHFRIGSITKTFTSTIVLQLIEEGKLSLDDTVATVLPELAAAHPEIAGVKVDNLLRMTSGIQDFLNGPQGIVSEIIADPTRVWKAEELVAAAVAAGVNPLGTPGYSTTNSIILQLMAEKIEGKPLPELITSRLVGPLGMTETSLPIADPSMPDPSTRGHLNALCLNELKTDSGIELDPNTDPTTWSISSAQGGGGATSTLSDLGAWAASASGTSLLGPDMQAQRLSPATTPLAEGDPRLYGLGIYELANSWFGHEGEAIGWEAIGIHNPSSGVTIAMAANACSGEVFVFYAILNELYPDPIIDQLLKRVLGES